MARLRGGLGALPDGVTRIAQVWGVAALGGHRLHGLAVHRRSSPSTTRRSIDEAKIGILAASVIAALLGAATLARTRDTSR